MRYRRNRPVAAEAKEEEATFHSRIVSAGLRGDGCSRASRSVHGLGPVRWTGDPASRLCGVWRAGGRANGRMWRCAVMATRGREFADARIRRGVTITGGLGSGVQDLAGVKQQQARTSVEKHEDWSMTWSWLMFAFALFVVSELQFGRR